MALVFPSDDALCAALRAGLVPAAVQKAAVRFRRTDTGELELEPTEPLAAGKKKGLENAGVVERASSGATQEAPCWAAALKPQWLGEPDTVPPLVLFVVEDAERLLPLCGELLRLGCDRQEVRMLGKTRALVRVREAPFFVVAKASEPVERLRVFAPSATEGIWLQLGWHHPLTEALDRPEKGTLLIHADGTFEELADGPFTPLDQLIVPVGLPAARGHESDEKPPRLQVKMRLLDSSKSDEVSLWVVRDGIGSVESLVRSAPEATLEGILFAVAGPLVLLKVRAGREKSVAALPGEGFARVAELPNLFAPRGLLLEPPLSRERLREWLSPDSEALVWLERGKDGEVVRQSIAETAFRPLSEWVDYVIDTSAPQLLAWMQSSTFDFQAWEGPAPTVSAETRGRHKDDDEDASEEEAPRPRRSPSARRANSKPEAPKAPAASALTLQQPETVARPAAEIEERLAAEEAAFLSLDAAADSPDRINAWNRLAGLYAAVQRHRESGLAFAHALWEVKEPDALVIARTWAQAAGSSLPALLEVSAPSEAQTRAVVAQLMVHALQKDASARARLQQAQAWLDRHDDNLDVRSLWLGRVALSLLAGGDTLGLARARDRVLARLRRGLSLERDVPRFVRSVGPGSSRDTARVARVIEQLAQMLKAFEETPRKRSLVEAPWPLTRAYVRITFAWAFARLGHMATARDLEREAMNALDLNIPVNNALMRLYRARIQQAAEGVSHDTPLVSEVQSITSGLNRDDRYAFDRMRQRCVILEPSEHLTPFWRFAVQTGVAHGEELSSLREITDVSQLTRAIEQRIDATESPQLDATERARLADGLLDNLLMLPESVALPLLNRIIAAAQTLPARLKAAVLEDALKVAGHFGRSELVKQLVAAIGSLMSELATAPAAGGDFGDFDAAGAAQLLAAGMRTLRRVGLRDEANLMLSRASQAFKGDNRDHLAARVAVAGGFAYLGRPDLAAPAIEEAIGHLSNETSPMFRRNAPDLTRLARAVARSLAMGPADFALKGLRRMVAPLPWLTDMNSMNTYLCLSVVELADIIAVGHVGEDLTLSEVTRTFLEEDEYRVRRRIHREATG